MGVFGKVVDYVGCNSKLVDAAEFESDIRSSDPRLLEAGANVATVVNVQICFEFTYVGTLGTRLQMRRSSLPSRIVVGRAVTRRKCPLVRMRVLSLFCTDTHNRNHSGCSQTSAILSKINEGGCPRLCMSFLHTALTTFLH